jgi:hypothetical protein
MSPAAIPASVEAFHRVIDGLSLEEESSFETSCCGRRVR